MDLQGQFARDLSKRCTAEFNAVHAKAKQYINNRKRMKTEMLKLFKPLHNSIVQCYIGDHSLCKQYSFVCFKPPRLQWPKHYLDESLKTGMTMSESDQTKVRELIGERLSEKAVENTYLNLNTQTVEGLNRKFQKTNPKNITSTRNFKARTLTSVVEYNLGLPEATHRMHKMSGHSVCKKIKEKISKLEERGKLIKAKNSSLKYKTTRLNKIKYLRELHRQTKIKKEELYKTGSGIDEDEENE